MSEVFGDIVGRMTTTQKFAIGLPMGAALLFGVAMICLMFWALLMQRRGRTDLYLAADDYVFSLYLACMVSCLAAMAGTVISI